MFNFLYKINPFFKGVIILVVSFLLSFIYNVNVNIGIFFMCIFLILIGSKEIIKTLKYLIPISIASVGLYFSSSSQGGGIILASRVFAFSSLGFLFSLTTDPYEFVKSLQKDAKLPRKFAYGILCAFNMIPYIKEEYKNAKYALEVRGLKVTVFSLKPIFGALVNSVKWSEALSIAMQSKGFTDSK